MICTGPREKGLDGDDPPVDPPGQDTVQVEFVFPVLLSAIDPAQEAKLVDLPKAMVSGSYLQEGEGVSAPVASSHGQQFHLQVRHLPLLVSSRAFVDEDVKVNVQRLVTGVSGQQLPQRLAAPGAGDWLDRLPGPVVQTETFSTASMYKAIVTGLNRDSTGLGNYYTTGGVAYRTTGQSSVAAEPTRNPVSVWEPVSSTAVDQAAYGPPGSDATQFRKVTAYEQTGSLTAGPKGPVYVAPEGVIQGTFNPAKLPGFAPLSKVPLSTFFPPTATGATPRARQELHDKPLGPTSNVAGYLGQPPLMLTTLRAASTFFNSKVWESSSVREAPIASIQVNVLGLKGANRASIHRVERVANEIYRATKLQVDITAGSSPTPVKVQLPAGGFGEPALRLQQGWVKKGVATIVLDAADAKDLALFVLILLVAGLFVANSVLASVRQRRGEIATLSTLGWARRHIFAAVLAEVAVVGLAAGVAGTAIAAVAIAAAGLHFTWLRIVLVIPASVVVAVAAGVVPAARVSRLSPLEGLAPAVRADAAGRRVRSVTRLGLVNLVRLPGRALLGSFGLVVGVGALAFLLGVQSAFSGAVAGNVLGNHIDVEIRGTDWVAVALILALGAGSVADVLIMNLRDRSGELAALRACGWADSSLRRLVVTEGIAVGLLGSLIGAGGGLAAVTALGANPATVAAGTAATFAAGVALCAVAVLPALAVLTRQLPAVSLASE